MQCSITPESDGFASTNRMRSGEYFGELALLNGGKRKANVVSVGGVDCFVLQRRDFMTSLGSHSQVRTELKRIGTERELEMKTRRKSAYSKRIKEVSLDELETVCNLGAGSYGAVTLVKLVFGHIFPSSVSLTPNLLTCDSLEPFFLFFISSLEMGRQEITLRLKP